MRLRLPTMETTDLFLKNYTMAISTTLLSLRLKVLLRGRDNGGNVNNV
jgi:hypothetical protein